MGTLVGYGSSSDEEEVAAEAISKPASTFEESLPSTTMAMESSPADQADANASRNAIFGGTTLGPLLGPAAPTNDGTIDGDSPAQTPENMSERDTIRYLTQAPIPMTSMPSSPSGSPDPAANARFARFMELKAKGVHFNEDLAGKSSFLNPGLLAMMMARAGIDEEDQYNTSLPLGLWNPKGLPEWAYKEELLKSQQESRDKGDAEKKALSAAGKRTIDFAPSRGNSGGSSRRSTPGFHKKRRRP